MILKVVSIVIFLSPYFSANGDYFELCIKNVWPLGNILRTPMVLAVVLSTRSCLSAVHKLRNVGKGFVLWVAPGIRLKA